MSRCAVCQDAAKYKCPRCAVEYCSLACFKKHGETCVNRFHEENLRQVMRGEVVSSDVREQTQQILQREMESAQEEALDMQEESDLLAVLNALEDPETFNMDTIPVYLREQFEAEMRAGLLEDDEEKLMQNNTKPHFQFKN